MWSNGDPVTADDFVYAFRRLQDPATAAEYASMLYVVKNSEAINATSTRRASSPLPRLRQRRVIAPNSERPVRHAYPRHP